MSSKLRSTAAALVLVLVTTTAAQALPLSFQAPGRESLLETAWGWLTSWFLPNEPLSANLSKEGGMMDLNGFPANDESLTSLAGCRSEEGGMMDPDGLR